MWVEAKAVVTVIGCIIISIVMLLMLFFIPDTEFFVMLLFMGMGFYIFGDILILSKTSKWWVRPWFEPCGSDREVGVVLTIAGGVAAIFTTKKPHGKREFVFHRQEASVINNGDYSLHTPNGNSAFLMHEDHDENLNVSEVQYAKEIKDELGTDDIKEVYNLVKEKENNARST